MTYARDGERDATLQSDDTADSALRTSQEARWYAVQVASGCEKRVKTNLEQRIQTFDVADKDYSAFICRQMAFRFEVSPQVW
ncbi:hypothetical protein NUACC21_70010 [Scytonema sp. NUACC21]